MTSLPPSYFDAVYARDPDPWAFATSPYERDKYAATLAALPAATYAEALEIGCSIGVFTAQLAARCASLCAIDPAAAALDLARRRCASLPHVKFAQMSVPDAWPAGRFDLVTLSEVVYYLDAPDVATLATRLRDGVRPGGTIILVHFIEPTNYPLSGDAASELLISHALEFADVTYRTRAIRYRLDVLIRR